jgi:tRNA (cmo5U34)-methyltransferase
MRDTTMPDGAWEFNEDVTSVFEDMLERSIPDYDKMRVLADHMAAPQLSLGVDPVRLDRVLDVGCSNGIALRNLDRFATEHGHDIGFLCGIDVSEPMLAKAREQSLDKFGYMNLDLRSHFPFTDGLFDVVLCVLTLQFTPVAHRQRVMDEINRVLRPGGRCILVEKVKARCQDLNHEMVSVYHDHKRDMGYTDEQIERKRLSLEGVMVPVTPQWNEQIMWGSGFAHVECFWRWINFAGWVAIK